MSASDASTTREVGTPPAIEVPAANERGHTIGRYLVIAELGRGGMGIVLRAYDPKLQREVALKVLRTERMSDDAQARMVREARAMARLSDPGVVAVYDIDLEATAGVLIAMECVAGSTLAAWLRASPRSWRLVVDTFVRAGRGLAAAHTAGVLHRDFKPANVLVDADPAAAVPPVVKVTDFGLARGPLDGERSSADGVRLASACSGSESGALTEAGAVMGTPAYMAPEQHAGGELDRRTDQFAFCVALWEGLTGERPYVATEQRSLAQMKHDGPPPWPASVVVPKRIVAAITRGLAPRPEDRWPDMGSLLAELGTVTQRRRGGVVLGLAGALLGGGAIALAVSGDPVPCRGGEQQLVGIWDDARRGLLEQAFLAVDRPFAADVWARVRDELDRFGADWIAMHRESCEATAVRREQSAAVLDMRMACLQRARTDFAATIGLLDEVDPALVRHADAIVAGLPELSRCADVEGLSADVAPPDASVAADVDGVRAELATVRALRAAGRYDDAAQRITAALGRARDLAYPPLVAEALQEHGRIDDVRGRFAAARDAHREALALAMRQGQWNVAVQAANSLVFVTGGRLHERETALAMSELAEALLERSDLDAARPALHNSLGFVALEAGDSVTAEAEFRRAVQLRIDQGGDPMDIARTRNNLGTALKAQGRHAEAELEYRVALASVLAEYGSSHPEAAVARTNLGSALDRLGRHAAAEVEHREALAVALAALGPDAAEVASAHNNLGINLSKQGRHADAAREYEAALAIHGRVGTEDRPWAAGIRNNLALALVELREYERAETEYRAAIATMERAVGAQHTSLAGLVVNLGNLLVDRGRVDEALPWLERAWALRRDTDVPLEDKGLAAFGLARGLWRHGERARALELRDRARALLVRAGTPGAQRLAELDQWARHDELPPPSAGG